MNWSNPEKPEPIGVRHFTHITIRRMEYTRNTQVYSAHMSVNPCHLIKDGFTQKLILMLLKRKNVFLLPVPVRE